MRKIRRLTQFLLTLLGTGIVVFAVLEIESTYERALLALLGLVLIEAGIWEFTRSLFPNEREFKPLRKETDYFLTIVRRLNRAGIRAHANAPGALDEVDRLHQEMHHSVDRMRRLAGRSDEELGFRYKPGVDLPPAAEVPTPSPRSAPEREVAARAS